MPDTSSLSELQAEWLRRFSSFRPVPPPADVLKALIAAGMIAATADGHRISPAGMAFLEAESLTVSRRPRERR